MIFATRTSPHLAGNNSVNHIMLQVIYALIPATLMLLYLFGWGLLSNLLFGLSFAVLLEAAFLKLRQRPIQSTLQDLSAIVTGWLLALALPAYSPWWLILIAMLFAIIIAKQLYGGLGYNPFNPAMVGYAAVLISFPLEMTLWPEPMQAGFGHISLTQALDRIFTGSTLGWDAYTHATPLDTVKVQLSLGQTVSAILQQADFGWLGSKGWELVSLSYLMGGLWLIYKRVITWHIPLALLASMASLATLAWLINANAYAPPLFHLFTGATMLGAFFIATDPVSASTTPIGKLIYAAGIGAFTWIIRTWGGYPDAIAFSVLLMNMAVPLIDYYTQPRVYGTTRRFK